MNPITSVAKRARVGATSNRQRAFELQDKQAVFGKSGGSTLKLQPEPAKTAKLAPKSAICDRARLGAGLQR